MPDQKRYSIIQLRDPLLCSCEVALLAVAALCSHATRSSSSRTASKVNDKLYPSIFWRRPSTPLKFMSVDIANPQAIPRQALGLPGKTALSISDEPLKISEDEKVQVRHCVNSQNGLSLNARMDLGVARERRVTRPSCYHAEMVRIRTRKDPRNGSRRDHSEREDADPRLAITIPRSNPDHDPVSSARGLRTRKVQLSVLSSRWELLQHLYLIVVPEGGGESNHWSFSSGLKKRCVMTSVRPLVDGLTPISYVPSITRGASCITSPEGRVTSFPGSVIVPRSE